MYEGVIARQQDLTKDAIIQEILGRNIKTSTKKDEDVKEIAD